MNITMIAFFHTSHRIIESCCLDDMITQLRSCQEDVCPKLWVQLREFKKGRKKKSFPTD